MDEHLAHLIPAIEEQIESSQTPYVKDVYERLLGEEGIDESEVKAMLAFCLADELEALQREGRDFSVERYKTLLSLLPVMPEGR